MKLLGIAAIIVALTVGYYFVIYLPQKDKAQQSAKDSQQAQQQAAQEAQKEQQKQDLQDCLTQAQNKFDNYLQLNSSPNPQPSQPDARTWNSWQLEDDASKQLSDDKTLCLKEYPQN